MKSPSMQISHALAVGFQTRNYQADQLCLLFLDKLFLLLNFHLQGNLLSWQERSKKWFQTVI